MNVPEEAAWSSVPIAEVIAETTSGDWGNAKPTDGLIECRVLRGTDFCQAINGNLVEAPIRYIRHGSVEKRKLQLNDLLVELSGGSDKQPTGRILHVSSRVLSGSDRPVLCSNFVKRLRVAAATVEPEFFSIYWSWLYEAGKTRIYQKRTTGIWNFKLADFLENECIAIPPKDEQRAITAVLRTVQRAKETCERVIAATRQLKQSLLHHLFTYGPVPFDQADKVPLNETEIGMVPEGWEVVKLTEAVQKTRQVDPSRMSDWKFRYVDVSCIDNEQLRITGYTEYQGNEAPSRARKPIRANDVIFATVRPYLKRVAVVPSNLDGHVCSTAFCVIRAKTDVADPSYLFFAVSHDRFVQKVEEHQRGSSYPAVTDSAVLQECIPLPPLFVQREIVAQLMAVDAKLAAEEARRTALDNLFKSLLHHLMTGKIRVNHLVREPAQAVG